MMNTGETPPVPDEAAGSAPLVLVAEDELVIAEIISLIVADGGAAPLLASDGARALELARAKRPALVITDLMMPAMDGAELIAALRADAEAAGHAPPPVILMTAAGAARARGIPADALLLKPFDVDDLEALVRRFLNAERGTGNAE
jgi:CheY-like chemotaxis protein